MAFDEKPHSWYTPRNATHHVLRGVLILACLVTVAAIIFQQQIRHGLENIRDSISTATCPARNSTPTIFREHEEFQTWDSRADRGWHDLVTPNGGFIIDPTRTDSEVYGIAMFHQLHCVAMFRNDFQELFARLDGRSDGMTNVLHHMDERHTLHCLDYLRQVSEAERFKMHLVMTPSRFFSVMPTDQSSLPLSRQTEVCQRLTAWCRITVATLLNGTRCRSSRMRSTGTNHHPVIYTRKGNS